VIALAYIGPGHGAVSSALSIGELCLALLAIAAALAVLVLAELAGERSR
jgi:hypothetical protein